MVGPHHPRNEGGVRRVFELWCWRLSFDGIVHWKPWMRGLFILVHVLDHAGTKFWLCMLSGHEMAPFIYENDLFFFF